MQIAFYSSCKQDQFANLGDLNTYTATSGLKPLVPPTVVTHGHDAGNAAKNSRLLGSVFEKQS